MEPRIKFPRTFHFPFSEGVASDDKIIRDYSELEGKEIVVTVKMDGENTTMYRDGLHARSIDSRHHESRNWVKGFHSMIQRMIPEGHRICGENLYAEHSIHYDHLRSYFYGFSAWNGSTCLSWDDTMRLFDHIGVHPVPVIFRGIFSEDGIKKIVNSLNINQTEGVVVRLAESFDISEYGTKVAKWVRRGHVQTDEHWMQREIKKNGRG